MITIHHLHPLPEASGASELVFEDCAGPGHWSCSERERETPGEDTGCLQSLPTKCTLQLIPWEFPWQRWNSVKEALCNHHWHLKMSQDISRLKKLDISLFFIFLACHQEVAAHSVHEADWTAYARKTSEIIRNLYCHIWNRSAVNHYDILLLRIFLCYSVGPKPALEQRITESDRIQCGGL